MKIKIDRDEWYPVYCLCKDGDWELEIDVPNEIVEIIEPLESAFKNMQEYLGKLFREARKNNV